MCKASPCGLQSTFKESNVSLKARDQCQHATLQTDKNVKPRSRPKWSFAACLQVQGVQGRSMSVKDGDGGGGRRAKSRSLGRCFSGPSIRVPFEKGRKDGLKRLDSSKLKTEIVRWAKAVATYARQVSGYLAGPPPSRPSERRGIGHVDTE